MRNDPSRLTIFSLNRATEVTDISWSNTLSCTVSSLLRADLRHTPLPGRARYCCSAGQYFAVSGAGKIHPSLFAIDIATGDFWISWRHSLHQAQHFFDFFWRSFLDSFAPFGG